MRYFKGLAVCWCFPLFIHNNCYKCQILEIIIASCHHKTCELNSCSPSSRSGLIRDKIIQNMSIIVTILCSGSYKIIVFLLFILGLLMTGKLHVGSINWLRYACRFRMFYCEWLTIILYFMESIVHLFYLQKQDFIIRFMLSPIKKVKFFQSEEPLICQINMLVWTKLI